MEFVVGQRWVSQAEPQLGLGLVTEREGRHITLSFPASEEERVYAADNAPLARVTYLPGDRLHDRQQRQHTVQAVEDLNGLKYYLLDDGSGGEQILPETEISDLIQLSSPTQRLYSGQFDRRRSFQLRVATLQHRDRQQRCATRGLIGPRTNLLPHQLYIAHEVASRFAPRVLLADEVGLGKTIEAGLILHQQLQTGLASRALIVVPEPLLHQWLVEMLRKFNLHFSLFDAARYEALREDGEDNPFESQQLVLCSLDLLCSDNTIAQQAAAGEWDLVIVDEAHHLHWSEEEISPAYRAVEMIAENCAGLLLLTATPEQLGMASHYARLHLLDSARFHAFDAFVEEQKNFVQLNAVVAALREEKTLSSEQRQLLQQFVDAPPPESTEEIRPLIRQLLDQHGTGRVLFRNTRAAIKGFPQRKLQAYPLPCPAQYSGKSSLYPEQQLQSDDWITCDPRVHWLEQFLKARRGEKVLLICAHCDTAVALEKHLHLNTGIRSTAFYEGLSIIERDRAAAYFADEESGAQILICSEIGSEGRNFQFAHQMVLFDLPTNPDLLEQRIGRLDRIGQTEDIQIHLPYLQDSTQEYLFRWYHDGVDAIEHSFSAGLSVYQHFEQQMQPWLDGSEKPDPASLTALLEQTRRHTGQVRKQLQQGRDQLLELNSCDDEVAAQLIDDINDSERSETLQEFIGALCDIYGVDNEFHSEHSLVLRPTEQMLTEHFPGLKEEGVTITFDREKAQRREEMEFLTWEHPIVTESMEMVIGSEVGNSCISAIQLKSLPAGTLLVECFFSLESHAPKRLQIDRFLSAAPLRVLLDSNGQNLSAAIQHEQLNKLGEHVKKSARPAIAKQVRSTVEKMVSSAEQSAQQQAAPLIAQAKQRVDEILGNEIQRLQQLQQLHGAIRQEEIDFFIEQKNQALAHIAQAAPELQAIRLIINT